MTTVEFMLFFIPLLFFITEVFYYILGGKRFPKLLRLPFEIVSLIIYPYLFFSFIVGSGSAWIGILAVLPFIIAYFLSCYNRKFDSEFKEGILNILLVAGLLINIILSIYIISVFHILLAVIGCLPLIIMFGIALVDNLRKEN